jgi:type 1 glutamine amidotransferase
VLLESRYTDDADAYVHSSWKEDIPRPQMYLHKVGKGGVLYLMLGHCRGKYDMRPFMDECPVDRGGWESEAFYELLRRGIKWGINKI